MGDWLGERGNAASFAISTDRSPASLVEGLPRELEGIRQLQEQIESLGNPIEFPDTSIFTTEWAESR